jgi:hypothetical protein
MPEASPPRRFAYTVDGQPFETEMPMISIALLKAKLPVEKRSFGVIAEGAGNTPDLWLDENAQISLEEGKMMHFYTSPPAMFG